MNPPTAILKPQRSAWAWLLPIAAAIFAIWLGWKAWSMRGVPISVQLEDGAGLKAGGEVRCRGIMVGTIEEIVLLPHAQGVRVHARLHPSARHLAVSGSRFWVVRPQLQLTRIAGLETLIGPRYLAVVPPPQSDKSHRAQREFIGLSNAPLVETTQPGDLEVILQAQQRGSLHPGAPVTFRQTRIGTIRSVGITSDGGAVEARAYIQQPFVSLIRPNTRFWDVGGIQAKLGLTGLSIEVESAEALLAGGVAIATPPPQAAGGDVVRTGHRFNLASKAEEEWLAWQPVVAIGSSLLPAGVTPPTPLRATIGWTQGRWGGLMKGQRSVQGWVLQMSEGLLGPADLLKPSEKADRETVVLEVAGVVVPLAADPEWERNGLALMKASVTTVAPPWPESSRRLATQPEECLVLADPAQEPLPLAASRLTIDGETWKVDAAVPLTASWHGACVLSRADGKLLGLLLVSDDDARIALLR